MISLLLLLTLSPVEEMKLITPPSIPGRRLSLRSEPITVKPVGGPVWRTNRFIFDFQMSAPDGFVIQRSFDLVSWTNFIFSIPNVGAITNHVVLDPYATNAQTFYRVRLNPATRSLK